MRADRLMRARRLFPRQAATSSGFRFSGLVAEHRRGFVAELRRTEADVRAELKEQATEFGGGSTCFVCGSDDPTVRLRVGRGITWLLWPDDDGEVPSPQGLESLCYWDAFHDPEVCVADIMALEARLRPVLWWFRRGLWGWSRMLAEADEGELWIARPWDAS